MQGPQAPGRGHQACPLSVGKSAVWIQAQPQGGQGEEVLGGVAETPRWTGSLLGSTRATAAPSSRRPPAAALSRPPRAMVTPSQLSSAGSRQPEVEDGRQHLHAGHLGSLSSFPALFVFECIRDTLMVCLPLLECKFPRGRDPGCFIPVSAAPRATPGAVPCMFAE